MKNVDLQKKLNKRKWLLSEKLGKDQSGKMNYCDFCEFAKKNGCDYGGTSMDFEIVPNPCATAYNRFCKRIKLEEIFTDEDWKKLSHVDEK